MCMWVCYLHSSLQQTSTCVCKRGAPGSAQERRLPRYMCVLCMRSSVATHGGVCVCVCMSSLLSKRQLLVYVCICMLPLLNDCNYTRLYFTDLYYKQSRYSRILIQLYHATLSISSPQIASHNKNHPHNTLTTLRLKVQRLMSGMDAKFAVRMKWKQF